MPTPVHEHLLSPVRPHSENGSVTARLGLLHGAHSAYDYNEVLFK
jgi:hypothetical protein